MKNKVRVTIELPKSEAERILSASGAEESALIRKLRREGLVSIERASLARDFQRVAKVAYFLWSSFMDAYAENNPIDQFWQHTFQVNAWALAFFRYCTKMTLGTRKACVCFADLSGTRSRNLAGRVSSWLWRKESGPCIMIDKDAIRSSSGDPSAQNRAVARLVLMHTGHVVLHWDFLTPDAGGREPLFPSTPTYEEEAWWFAESIVGLMLGAYSRQLIEHRRYSDAWQFV